MTVEAQKIKEPSLVSARIKEEAHRLGFALVGISRVQAAPHEESFAEWLRRGLGGELGYLKRTEEVRRDPRKLVPWASSVVSVGMNYATPFSRPVGKRGLKGWISRYAWGDDYHDVMKQRLEALLDKVQELYPGPVVGKAFVDSGPVLERDLAGVAGIGWIGKNTQLISPRRGSWFFLGELFLSLELTSDRPIKDRCGRCQLCLKACPTGAFVGPYILDARRCISYLTIELKGPIPTHLRPLVGNHVFGCDICQEVCPYNVKATPTSEEAFYPREGLYAPELIPLLSLSEEEFRRRFRQSPILRAKRRGFLRNVAVALGNLRKPEAVPALTQALGDHEPLVRRHVAWALGQIATPESLEALGKRLEIESDREVREEIEEAMADVLSSCLPGLQIHTKKGILPFMKAIKAHYDGRVVVPEEPINLPVNTPVRVLVPEADDSAAVTKAFAKLSETSFSRIWDNDEDAAYDKL
ncbi:MAG: tRNA epoxyqueuosine(34) reductase QueG [Deltaproteobacteria bacterium RIFCSPLOWO2_02_FULL_57_26]|nr:MAG: tRNA epoxyqueuosine(34) reductase QueG [Deltaproteobacteria bacterium RIFCSPLOWO2_02_FULL_57_26]